MWEFLITIPAGETEVTVVPLSTDLRTPPSGVTPESITWIGAFLSIRSGTIGDTVFCDINANGIQDGPDFGLQNVKVILTCVDNNGQTVILDTRTDVNGKYLFEGLPPAICDVEVDLSTVPSDCDDPVPNCPPLVNVNLGPGEVFLDADFCFTRPKDGLIGDTVYCDLNGNKVQDPNEPGIGGVTVILNCSGYAPIAAVTDGAGKYLFTNVPLGVACSVTIDPNTLPADCNIPVCEVTIQVSRALKFY